jgi:hypothetical protein
MSSEDEEQNNYKLKLKECFSKLNKYKDLLQPEDFFLVGLIYGSLERETNQLEQVTIFKI